MLGMGAFAERLKKVRESQGLSQRAIALATGITPAQISRYEAGLQSPTEDAIRKIAQFLGVSADYLLGLTDDPIPKSGELPAFIKEKLKRLEELEKERERLLEIIEELKKIAEKLG